MVVVVVVAAVVVEECEQPFIIKMLFAKLFPEVSKDPKR